MIQYPLRIPRNLLEQIRLAAAGKNVSIQAWLRWVLTEAVERDEAKPG